MIALVPAVAGALIVAGIIGLVVGLKPAPVRRPRSRPVRRKPMSAATKRLLLVGVVGGCLAWLVTGWALALVAVPLACVGVPMLLSSSGASARIDRLVHHAEVVALKGDSYRLKNRELGRVPAAVTEEN